MQANHVRIGLGVFGVLSALSANAGAQLPSNQFIRYSIHEKPRVSDSDVVFVMEFELAAVERDGDEVGWAIETAYFHEIGDNGEEVGVWADTDVEIPTPDGLWWIKHNEPLAPVVSEFADIPHLDGQAETEDPQDDDLNYEVEGDPYAQGNPPYTDTVLLTYSLQRTGASEWILNEEDKPVESDAREDPD